MFIVTVAQTRGLRQEFNVKVSGPTHFTPDGVEYPSRPRYYKHATITWLGIRSPCDRINSDLDYLHSPCIKNAAQKKGDDQRFCLSISSWARRKA